VDLAAADVDVAQVEHDDAADVVQGHPVERDVSGVKPLCRAVAAERMSRARWVWVTALACRAAEVRSRRARSSAGRVGLAVRRGALEVVDRRDPEPV